MKRRPIILRFHDHVSGVGGKDSIKAYEIELCGFLVGETPTHYQIMTWVAGDDLTDENNEWVSVLKSTVTGKKFLK